MDDRTMLELAAKAAGVDWMPATTEKGIELEPVFGLWLRIHGEPSEHQRRRWNSLTDDGDALRLAVKLGMEVYIDNHPNGCECVEVESHTHKAGRFVYNLDDDPGAATRRAITRAAAEIQLSKGSK